MAIGFLRTAITNPGHEIEVFDHHGYGARERRDMVRRIMGLAAPNVRKGRSRETVIAETGVRLDPGRDLPPDPVHARFRGVDGRDALRDLEAMVHAILHLGVTPEAVLRTVRNAVVGSVMGT